MHVWLRADGRLPDDPVLHACVVTYASDMTLLDTATLPFAMGAMEEVIRGSRLQSACQWTIASLRGLQITHTFSG